MRYLDFLARVHEVLAPPTYLEIGIRHGDSLALADAPSIGVDPQPRLEPELRDAVRAKARIYRETSDAFFARPRPLRAFAGRRAALSFIDGMHLAEFALRDFAGVERLSRWTSVAVFDDVLPRSVEMASRERTTRAWTGDVFKVTDVLSRLRPDLILLRVDTQPTGLLLVLGLDPESGVLVERQDEIAAELATPDPQAVPAEVLERRGALDPEAVLGASFWSVLRDRRGKRVEREAGVKELRSAVRADFGRDVAGGGGALSGGPVAALRRVLPLGA